MFRDPGKKSFMFFTSELGKGFIISDEEEVRPLLRSRSYIANKGLWGKAAISLIM